MTAFSSSVQASVIADVTSVQKIVRSRQARNIVEKKIAAKEFELNHSFIKAVIAGDIKSVQVLLKEGANVNFIEGRGDTALLIAVNFGYENMVKFLVANGANVNFVKDITGDTALHFAANQGYQKIVEFLVDNGANVNFKVKDGDTALFLALDSGHDNIVEFLVERGADVDAIDDDNQVTLIRLLGRKQKYNADQINKAIDVLKNKEICPISLEYMTVGNITITDCNHAFNSDCLVGWLSKSLCPTCPTCRAVIVHEEDNSLFLSRSLATVAAAASAAADSLDAAAAAAEDALDAAEDALDAAADALEPQVEPEVVESPAAAAVLEAVAAALAPDEENQEQAAAAGDFVPPAPDEENQEQAAPAPYLIDDVWPVEALEPEVAPVLDLEVVESSAALVTPPPLTPPPLSVLDREDVVWPPSTESSAISPPFLSESESEDGYEFSEIDRPFLLTSHIIDSDSDTEDDSAVVSLMSPIVEWSENDDSFSDSEFELDLEDQLEEQSFNELLDQLIEDSLE